MKVTPLLYLALLALAACQSARPLYPTGLYRTAADFRQQRPALAGTGAGKVFLARKAYVVNAPGRAARRTTVPLDSVWGYAGANHEAYRFFERRPYEVEQADTLAVYSVLVSNGKSSSRVYYFSSGLTGPVLRLSRKNLRRTYPANPRFLALLHAQKWYQSLAAFNAPPGQSRSFRIVALYRQSLGLPTSYSP